MKIKIVRVVTASYVVPWHLHNTLTRSNDAFDIYVVGDGVSVYKDTYHGVNFVDIKINRKINLIYDFVALVKLSFFLIKCRPRIVHSIMPKSGLLSAIAGFISRVPIRIHTYTGQTWMSKEGVSHDIYYKIDKLINKLNTHCLTDSPSQSNFLAENGIAKNNVALPYLSKGSLSGVDIDKFNLNNFVALRQKIKHELDISEDDFIFSFIARKTKEKGAIDMLLAFQNVCSIFPQCKLLFIGPDEDNEIEQLEKTRGDLFKNVITLGHVDNHEHYLSVTNVLCLPSYREGFGSIIIDAASMAIPSIGSRITGLIDSIEDGVTGWLFPPGDLSSFSDLMIQCVQSPERCRLIGRNARKRVEDYFAADILKEELDRFYFLALAE